MMLDVGYVDDDDDDDDDDCLYLIRSITMLLIDYFKLYHIILFIKSLLI